MLENLFTSNPWIWLGLVAGLAALPPLIHLINLLQHRRVRWAAMDFLLKSHRQNKNWIRLKQILLLLTRVAILLGLLVMLANVGCESNQLAQFLGGATTHHYVLLDDSMSMSEVSGGKTIAARASEIVRLIGSRAAGRSQQKFTLLRASATKGWKKSSAIADPFQGPARLDLDGIQVDDDFQRRLDVTLNQIEETFQAISLGDGLAELARLTASRQNENAIVYVVSDFRKPELQQRTDWRVGLDELAKQGAGTELIMCAESPASNLAVIDMQPQGNVQVAGTPILMKVAIHNFGTVAARNVQVGIRMEKDESGETGLNWEEAERIPNLLIESIAPGETMERLFPVFFEVAGEFAIRAELPDDALIQDNQFWCALSIDNVSKVLILSSSGKPPAALQLGLNPGRMTGLESEAHTIEFLRDASGRDLDVYHAIFVVDVAGFDAPTIAKLESYCQRGGGVIFFCGPQVNSQVYNQFLYRNGAGVFPVALDKPIDLPPKQTTDVADIQVKSDHPLTKPYSTATTPLLDLVEVRKFFAIAPSNDDPKANENIDIVGTIRGNAAWPCIVTKEFGAGRVVAVMTSVDSQWNNWQNTPTYPPMLLVTHDYAVAGRRDSRVFLVGQDVAISLDSDELAREVNWYLPSRDPLGRLKVVADWESQSDGGKTARLPWKNESGAVQIGYPGVGRIEYSRSGGEPVIIPFSLSANSQESNLDVTPATELLSGLRLAKPKTTRWDQFNPAPEMPAGSSWTRLVFVVLLGLFLLEQGLAFWNSYHPSSIRRALPS